MGYKKQAIALTLLVVIITFAVIVTTRVYGDESHIAPAVSVDYHNVHVTDTPALVIFPKTQVRLYVVSKGISMYPVLAEGALVAVVDATWRDVRVGDFLLVRLRLGDTTYERTHQLIAIGGDSDGWYGLTQGSNTQRSDAPALLRKDGIIGKIIAIVYDTKIGPEQQAESEPSP